MVRARTSAALVFAIFVAASSERVSYASTPEAEEEEAAQMNVKLLQVGTVSQRGGREEFLDDEDENDEVELAQVRVKVKSGVHRQVGVSADGGVRARVARGLGVAGRVAFRVAGDGTMVLDSDEDEDDLLGKVQLLQTKTQVERPVRSAEDRAVGFEQIPDDMSEDQVLELLESAGADDGSEAVDGWEANWDEGEQGGEDYAQDVSWDGRGTRDELADMDPDSAEQIEEFSMAGTDSEFSVDDQERTQQMMRAIASHEDALAAGEEDQWEELSARNVDRPEGAARAAEEDGERKESLIARRVRTGAADDEEAAQDRSQDERMFSSEVRRMGAGAADEDETSTVEAAPLVPAEDSESFDDTADDEEMLPSEEAAFALVEDDDASLSEVQLLQTKTSFEPVRVVQHRGSLSAESNLLTVGVDVEKVTDEEIEEAAEEYEAEEQQEQLADEDGTYEAYAADDADSPAVEEWDAEAEGDNEDAPYDINEDSARVALLSTQRGAAEDTAIDAEGDSSSSGTMQIEDDYEDVDEDAHAKDASAEESLEEDVAMADEQNDEDLYADSLDNSLDEAAATPVLGQEGSFVEIVADADEEYSQSGTMEIEQDPSLLNEDADQDALAEGALVEVSAMSDLDREQLYEELLEAEPAGDGTALFGEGANIPDTETPTEQLVPPNRDDAANVGLSFFQIDGDVTEAEDESYFSAEAALLSTQLMQQDVVTLMQKPVSPVVEDIADDHVGLLSGIPVAAGRNTVAIDQDGEVREVEAGDDRSHSTGSGLVAMEVSADGYTQWE